MKADDIRSLNHDGQKECNESETANERKAGLDSLKVCMLTEIAAQLSEANEYLKMYSNPPMVFEGTHLNPDAFSDLPQPITFIPSEPRATLRDQFAMAAMAGNWLELVDGEQANGDPKGTMTGVDFAKWAYNLADAMMEARKK
jgi:hypothetical protein